MIRGLPTIAGACFEDGCENIVFPFQVISWRGINKSCVACVVSKAEFYGFFNSELLLTPKQPVSVAYNINNSSFNPICFLAVCFYGVWTRKKKAEHHLVSRKAYPAKGIRLEYTFLLSHAIGSELSLSHHIWEMGVIKIISEGCLMFNHPKK